MKTLNHCPRHAPNTKEQGRIAGIANMTKPVMERLKTTMKQNETMINPDHNDFFVLMREWRDRATKCGDESKLCIAETLDRCARELEITAQIVARHQSAAFHIGNFRIIQMGPGKFWMSNGDGEGMETSELKLAAHLEKYFKREF